MCEIVVPWRRYPLAYARRHSIVRGGSRILPACSRDFNAWLTHRFSLTHTGVYMHNNTAKLPRFARASCECRACTADSATTKCPDASAVGYPDKPATAMMQTSQRSMNWFHIADEALNSLWFDGALHWDEVLATQACVLMHMQSECLSRNC